jgi:3-(3-hydroxy-phenyl)propionate hydroxylase
MQPYTYSGSPLTPYAWRDGAFAGGPASGSAAPNARLTGGSYLLDRPGLGMTALLFTDAAPDARQQDLLADLAALDPRFAALVIRPTGAAAEPGCITDPDGAIARTYAAPPGAFYLLRPDLHIAGRWSVIEPEEILQTARLCLGRVP